MAVDERAAKTERIEARLTPDAKQVLTTAARLQGRSLTDFLIHSAVNAANEVIRERQFLDMAQRDRVAFAESVLNPPQPNANLRRAARRHSALLDKR